MKAPVGAFALVVIALSVSGFGDASPRVVDEQIGLGHRCRLLSDETVECRGSNLRGQLGRGVVGGSSPAWLKVYGLGRVRGLAVGGGHNCALLLDTTVRCWGSNTNGQLGDGTQENRSRPIEVDGLRGVTALTGGMAHTCALLRSTTVSCWGYAGAFGPERVRGKSALGHPVPLPLLDRVAQIEAGPFQICAVRLDGQVWCAGYNGDRAISNSPGNQILPRRVTDLSPATRIAVGEDPIGQAYACALLRTGAIRCRGDGAPQPSQAARLFR